MKITRVSELKSRNNRTHQSIPKEETELRRLHDALLSGQIHTKEFYKGMPNSTIGAMNQLRDFYGFDIISLGNCMY